MLNPNKPIEWTGKDGQEHQLPLQEFQPLLSKHFGFDVELTDTGASWIDEDGVVREVPYSELKKLIKRPTKLPLETSHNGSLRFYRVATLMLSASLACMLLLFGARGWKFEHKDTAVNKDGDLIRTHHIDVLQWDLPPFKSEFVPRVRAATEQLHEGAIVDHEIQRVYPVKSGKIDIESSDEMTAGSK